MATRRDQLHSYQFMTQRVISAFVMRETDPLQSPLRRGVGAVFGGLMVAVMVAAGFGIAGIITKVGGDKWKADGSVVIEKETGASFVYLGGALHPTVNYASALLAAGRPNPSVFRVAGKSLGSTPRATPVGIPGAPNSLPTANRRVGLPWTICARPGADNSGRTISTTMLAVAVAPAGGRRLTDEAMLVKDFQHGTTWLVWHGRRFHLQDSRTVVAALFGAAGTVPVGTAWLDALPAGTDIAPITVDRTGQPSAEVPGRKIGDVLVTQTGSGPQHYLVFNDGVAPITELQQTILAARSPVQAQQVAAGDITGLPRSDLLGQVGGDGQPPTSPPTLSRPGAGEQICAVTGDATTTPVVLVGGTVPGLDHALPTGSASVEGTPLADRVLVPSGRVATVRALAAPSARSGPYYVVSDLGIRYPVSSAQVLPALGYSPEQAVDVPASLVARIPSGPTLDPEAATRPAATAGPAAAANEGGN
jgi:type VII secretion protein EccB